MLDADVIIVGSGPAGVHAAQTLLEAGATTLMIDGGRTGPNMDDAPTTSFTDIRRTQNDQWQWFLGKDLSAIPLDGLTGGLGGWQVSGNRNYVTQVNADELPLTVQNGFVRQSLARGGLGTVWGAACALLTPSELTVMGLPAEKMEYFYEIVGKRIGISGPPTRPWIQPPLPLDHHASFVAKYAEHNASTLQTHHWKASQPHSAILTHDLHERKASSLNDMEYWADPYGSVYRPEHTLQELLRFPGFRYMPGKIVRHIRLFSGHSAILARSIATEDGKEDTFTGRQVILACNAVNTARILLGSLQQSSCDVPFLSKPRVLSACINPHMLGGEGNAKRVSLCQYLLTDETLHLGLPRACAQLYSYRSLLLFRLMGKLPLPVPQAMRLAALLTPALVIADIRFPVNLRNAAWLRLEAAQEPYPVSIQFRSLPLEERQARSNAWKSVRRALRTVHLLPVKNMQPPEGFASHFAGTVPNAEAGTYALTSDTNGQSRELPGTWIADASTFRALSPKPHTFTIMANACRVAEQVLQRL